MNDAIPAATVTAVAPTVPGAGRCAGFWRRAAAWLIDGLLVTVVTVLATLLLGFARVPLEIGAVVAQVVFWLGGGAYLVVMHASPAQATLGKQALGIKVTDLQGERIGLGRSVIRCGALPLSGLVAGLGFVLAAFTPRRQALHDMLAGTLVVSRDATPSGVRAGLAPPQVSPALVVGIAAVGLLAVGAAVLKVAIPEFAARRVRAQVAEGLSEAQRFEEAVIKLRDTGLDADDIVADSLDVDRRIRSRYVRAIDVSGAIVTIKYGRDAATEIAGKDLVLVPTIDARNQVVWICGKARPPEAAGSMMRHYTQATTVPEAYLPANCR